MINFHYIDDSLPFLILEMPQVYKEFKEYEKKNQVQNI